MNINLPTNDDGSGVWTIVHPDLGTLYTLTIERAGFLFDLTLTDTRNETVIDQDTLTDVDENVVPAWNPTHYSKSDGSAVMALHMHGGTLVAMDEAGEELLLIADEWTTDESAQWDNELSRSGE